MVKEALTIILTALLSIAILVAGFLGLMWIFETYGYAGLAACGVLALLMGSVRDSVRE
jgi:hypothetical protein